MRRFLLVIFLLVLGSSQSFCSTDNAQVEMMDQGTYAVATWAKLHWLGKEKSLSGVIIFQYWTDKDIYPGDILNIEISFSLKGDSKQVFLIKNSKSNVIIEEVDKFPECISNECKDTTDRLIGAIEISFDGISLSVSSLIGKQKNNFSTSRRLLFDENDWIDSQYTLLNLGGSFIRSTNPPEIIKQLNKIRAKLVEPKDFFILFSREK